MKTINAVLADNSYCLIFAYATPLILDGSDWKSKILASTQNLAKDYEIFDRTSGASSPSNKEFSQAYNEFWKVIKPHFRYDYNVMDSFYEPFNISKHVKEIRKVIWIDIERNKPVEEVLGYLESVSGYICYMEDNKI